MKDSGVHIVLLLKRWYQFPHCLQHFPLSASIYQWLSEHPHHRLTIITPTPIILPNKASDQIDIHYIRLPRFLLHRLIYAAGTLAKLFSIRIKRIMSKEYASRLIKLRLDIHADKGLEGAIIPDSVFVPLDDSVKSTVKQTVANESEYFICTANFHDTGSFIFLLKAFSILKKRQRSGIKLMLTGIHPDTHPGLFKQISQYKYRSDIILLNAEIRYDYTTLLGAAYAQIYPSQDLFYPSGIWEAAKMNIPVIAPKNNFSKQDTTGAFLYFEKDVVEDLADKMMILYKDEGLRKKIISQSLQLLETQCSLKNRAEQIHAIFDRKGV